MQGREGGREGGRQGDSEREREGGRTEGESVSFLPPLFPSSSSSPLLIASSSQLTHCLTLT